MSGRALDLGRTCCSTASLPWIHHRYADGFGDPTETGTAKLCLRLAGLGIRGKRSLAVHYPGPTSTIIRQKASHIFRGDTLYTDAKES